MGKIYFLNPFMLFFSLFWFVLYVEISILKKMYCVKLCCVFLIVASLFVAIVVVIC